MAYFPILVQLSRQPVVVFGGGAVAERKVGRLLQAGAEITVVAPQLTKQLAAWAEEKKIKHRRRRYRPGDLSGFILAFAATDDESTNAQIAQEAGEHNILANVADRPQLCSFILPSVLTRGELVVAVSTSGKSPALAKKIREELENYFGPEYEEYLDIMARVRERVRAKITEEARREELFTAILDSDILQWLREGKKTEIDEYLEQVLLGAGLKSAFVFPEGVDS